MKFKASAISALIEDGVAILGFADDQFNPTCYLMLSRTLEPSRQDLTQGLDKPHLEVNSQKNSYYGGLREARLSRSRLMVMLEEEAATKMSIDKEIEVDFTLKDEKLREVSQQLRLVLGDDSIHVEIDNS